MPAGLKVPKLSMSYIKDIIYIIIIVLGVFYHFRDKAVTKAVFNLQVETMQDNQKEILKKLQENDLRWDEQQEKNGNIFMFIQLSAGR